MIISEIFSDFNDSMVDQEQPKVWHLGATEPGLSRGALAMEGTGEDKKSSFFFKLGSDMWGGHGINEIQLPGAWRE